MYFGKRDKKNCVLFLKNLKDLLKDNLSNDSEENLKKSIPNTTTSKQETIFVKSSRIRFL